MTCVGNPDVFNLDPGASQCDGTPFGQDCNHVCLPGFEASQVASCTENGWVGGTCTESTCSNPPGIENFAGFTDCALPVDPNSLCTYTCAAGYVATNAIECRQGAFSQGQCEPAACEGDPAVENMLPGSCIGTASGDRCPLQCDVDFHPVGQPRCTLGQWQLDDARCELIEQCGPPAVENGYFDSSFWDAAHNGDPLDPNQIICHEGYARTLVNALVCECFGVANEPCATLTGVCEEVYCPAISTVADGPIAGADWLQRCCHQQAKLYVQLRARLPHGRDGYNPVCHGWNVAGITDLHRDSVSSHRCARTWPAGGCAV